MPYGNPNIVSSAGSSFFPTPAAASPAPQSQWTAAAYALNFSDFGAPFQGVQYSIPDPSGFWHLRGVCKKTVAWVTGETILTLPPAFRPLNKEMFTSWGFDATAGAAVFRIDVDTSGAVILAASAPNIGVPAALSYLTLSAVLFSQVP